MGISHPATGVLCAHGGGGTLASSVERAVGNASGLYDHQCMYDSSDIVPVKGEITHPAKIEFCVALIAVIIVFVGTITRASQCLLLPLP